VCIQSLVNSNEDISVKPKIHTGKLEKEDDFSLAPKILSGAYVLRNFSDDDNVMLDLSLIKKSSFATVYSESEKVGNDLSLQFKDVKNGKLKTSLLIEGVYGENSLDYVTLMTPWSTEIVCLDTNIDYSQYLIPGTSGNDITRGTSQSDQIDGCAGDDLLDGGAGDDKFFCGPGNDTLTGGSGEDSFKFFGVPELSKGNTVFEKTITDFEKGVDEIDIGSLALAYKLRLRPSETLQTWKKGSVIFVTDGTDGWVYGNFDSDKLPEMKIKLSGITEMADDDGFFKQGL
jgi:hypothetical protein